jgi:hypothetical protein
MLSSAMSTNHDPGNFVAYSPPANWEIYGPRPRFTREDAAIERRMIELMFIPGEFERLQKKLDRLYKQWNV